MPVEDHAVHDRVKIDDSTPYGCYNKTRTSTGYQAPDRRYKPDGTFYVIQTKIFHKTSIDCRYDRHQEDPRCAGCTTKKDYEYLTRMAAL